MADAKKRTKKFRQARGATRSFSISSEFVSQPFLVIATDICFWFTLTAVAFGFGGRMATGQIALVVGASATALCWMLHQLTTSEPRYLWTGSEWIWALGILVGIAQIVPLPVDLLVTVSPHIKEILPLWFDKEFAEIIPVQWNQLSLNPWETASGLATFVSYALLFLVASQRLRTIQDVEWYLCAVSISVIAMMLFAQIQFLMSNGKFFWTYEHPFMTTDSYPVGCFTNRNHLAQFLALGIGPLVWWLLRRLQQQEIDQANRNAMPVGMHSICVTLLLTSLCAIALTVLMTLSRGGFMAIALASCVSVALMCRIGLASMKFGVAVMLVGVVTSGLFSYSKYETFLASRLKQQSGRSEIWMANLKVAQDFPILGTGVGTHADAYRLRFEAPGEDRPEYTHAESGYLQVASESGLAGLIVAGLMIATSLWWCFASLWNPDTRVTSAAVAILASVIANVAHAAGDFFWYTPICMLILATQLACAARLYRLTRQKRGAFVFSFPAPRFATVLAICGLAPLACWMFDLKMPALLAEPHHIESILLARTDGTDLSEDEIKATNLQRIKEILLAAKFDPRNSKYQESAATSYMELFDLKQERAENTMSIIMIRDAVIGSQFETVKAANEWLDRAVGANAKLLRLSASSTRRSIANCPLRAKSYVLLTEISFIERQDDVLFQKNCLEQSLKLRPFDADSLYLVGRAHLQEGNMEKALSFWRPSFEQSPRNRERISDLLAIQMSPEFFENEFHPDWTALEIIGNAFAKSGRETEAQEVKREYIRQAVSKAKAMKTDTDLEKTVLSIRMACREIGDFPTAVNVLTYTAKRLPQSYIIRYMLSLDLVESGQPGEAAEHLKWCSARRPGDKGLRQLATYAVTEHIKQARTAIRSNEETDQNAIRR